MRVATEVNGGPVTARALEAAIRRRGFVPGAPAWVGLFSRLAETMVCQRMKCRCGRRGLDYRPFNDGGDGYRVLAACPDCGLAEEI
jgi:hypothetical protein